MDRHYFGEIKKKDNILFALNPVDLMKVASADCIISDHGLHALQLLLKLSDITFVDVWHGIPFKGFTADDFTIQQQYDEIWVSSALLKDSMSKNLVLRRPWCRRQGWAAPT
jgi:hypothetical protein